MDLAGSGSLVLRPLDPHDWLAVRRIYELGIASGHATFQTEAPDWEEWNRAHLADARLVATVDETIVGWAALSPVSSRCVYRGVAEVSIYVDPAYSGRGIGSRLLAELIRLSEVAGIWTLQAGIFPENAASLRLHARSGFREVGRRERIGCLHGSWRDVLLLERRSLTEGLR